MGEGQRDDGGHGDGSPSPSRDGAAGVAHSAAATDNDDDRPDAAADPEGAKRAAIDAVMALASVSPRDKSAVVRILNGVEGDAQGGHDGDGDAEGGHNEDSSSSLLAPTRDDGTSSEADATNNGNALGSGRSVATGRRSVRFSVAEPPRPKSGGRMSMERASQLFEERLMDKMRRSALEARGGASARSSSIRGQGVTDSALEEENAEEMEGESDDGRAQASADAMAGSDRDGTPPRRQVLDLSGSNPEEKDEEMGVHDSESSFSISACSSSIRDSSNRGLVMGDASIDEDADAAEPSLGTKQRTSPSGDGVGAVQVNERAPQVNRRFFLGLTRPSARRRARRRRRARQGSGTSNEQGSESASSSLALSQSVEALTAPVTLARDTSSASELLDSYGSAPSGIHGNARHRSTPLVEAQLVEEQPEVPLIVAKRVGYRRWRVLAAAMSILVVLLTTLLAVFLTRQRKNNAEQPPLSSSSAPPSSAPTVDPRTTLEVMYERGYVRCGMSARTVESAAGLYYDLCRSVAAVLFGNPDKFEGVTVTPEDRFRQLQHRSVDMLVFGDTHTLEREVRERTTGTGLAFSSTFYYDGTAFFGNETFVKCAEEQRRYGECSSLRICVDRGTTALDFVESKFPTDFLVIGSTREERGKLLSNFTCNVVADDRSYELEEASSDNYLYKNYVVGDKLMTREPLAIVTRKGGSDRELSDIVNKVLHALFFGEEQGLTADPARCPFSSGPGGASDLDYLNAVYCVGNYGDIFVHDDRGMNRINNGTAMLYAIPHGDLEPDADGSDIFLENLRTNGILNCGVVSQNEFDGNSTGLVGLSADYCRTLSAALYNGNSGSVNFRAIPNENALDALMNGTIDVIAGFRVDLAEKNTSFTFSMPFYFGNETASEDVSFYSMAVRDDDGLFPSFVNSIVLATIYAQENGIPDMPLITLFGSDLRWSWRDAISYSGSHHRLVSKNFDNIADEERGRNVLNNKDGPQIHSFPGLREYL